MQSKLVAGRLRYSNEIVDQVCRWLNCICDFTVTAQASGRMLPFGDTCAMLAINSTRLHKLTRADCTTRNRRKQPPSVPHTTAFEDRIAVL